MFDIKVEVIDYEDEEEMDLWGDHQYALRERNTPERCPRTRTVQDCLEKKVQENHQMTNQVEDLTIIKVEDEEDWMMGDPPYMSDVEEDDPVHVTTETPSKNSKRKIMLPIKYEEDDEDITQCSSRENDITCNVHPESPSTDPSYNPPNDEEPSPDRSQITTNPDLSCNLSNHEEPSPDQSQIVTTDAGPEVDTKFESDEDEKQNTKVSGLFILRKSPQSEPSYICSHCGKSFTNKAYLLAHQRNHKGEKPYICSECGKCFIYKSQFANHERSHTGEKPYACSECGKCYTNKSALIKHHRSHTGEKPYSCPQCGKRFITRTRLTDHYRIHTGEKPYSCSICGKCFTQKSNLVRHEKIHTKEIRTEEDSNFEIL
ncbi:zinc finger protein 41-like [Bufo gargarizans]|uniref:zinc finger protein 41-like n=1 Tax=Bufo gargarizans TaxID=30331 RepID=UPI001CF5FB13|nr:zinc finger protein 41-like [Bufo gargarizans]